VLAVVAPGQGSQTPGFLAPWLDLPGARARLAWLSELCGLDLVELGTRGDAEAIRDTAVTQPLLVAAGMVAAGQLPLDEVAVVAGHSVGELTAAALAGVLTQESAVALARVRGREMAAACRTAPTGMSAVLGGDPAEVLVRVEAVGLTAANRNAAGQLVAAGDLDALAALKADPPAKARVVPLQVAGAFHTPYMAAAEQALAAVADGVPAADPVRLLLSNADGTAMATGTETVKRLVAQVTSPVRWDLCQATLRDLGVSALIELPPAGTLVGLARRELPGIATVAIKTPDDLAAARDLVAGHTGPTGSEPTVAFRVVVAPCSGTFGPADWTEGDAVPAGQPVGHVTTRQGGSQVSAGYDAVLVEWLAHDGDPVAAGQPLARLHRTGRNR